MGAIYQAKCKTGRKIFGHILGRDYQKCDLFKVAKRMVKYNEGITGEQFIVNDDSVLTGTQEDSKIAWKSYHKRILNTEFAWNLNRLSQAVSSVPCSINQHMFRESTSKMKNGKTARLSGAVPKMAKAPGKAGVYIITHIVNQTIVEGVVPA